MIKSAKVEHNDGTVTEICIVEHPRSMVINISTAGRFGRIYHSKPKAVIGGDMDLDINCMLGAHDVQSELLASRLGLVTRRATIVTIDALPDRIDREFTEEIVGEVRKAITC